MTALWSLRDLNIERSDVVCSLRMIFERQAKKEAKIFLKQYTD